MRYWPFYNLGEKNSEQEICIMPYTIDFMSLTRDDGDVHIGAVIPLTASIYEISPF